MKNLYKLLALSATICASTITTGIDKNTVDKCFLASLKRIPSTEIVQAASKESSRELNFLEGEKNAFYEIKKILKRNLVGSTFGPEIFNTSFTEIENLKEHTAKQEHTYFVLEHMLKDWHLFIQCIKKNS